MTTRRCALAVTLVATIGFALVAAISLAVSSLLGFSRWGTRLMAR